MTDLDEYERYLFERLRLLREAYDREAEPLIRELVKLKSMRPLPPILVTIEQAEAMGHKG